MQISDENGNYLSKQYKDITQNISLKLKKPSFWKLWQFVQKR